MENPIHDLRRTIERERRDATPPHSDAHSVRRSTGPQLLPVVLTLSAVAALVMMLRPRRDVSDDADPLFQRF